jgi:hypothetical protein
MEAALGEEAVVVAFREPIVIEMRNVIEQRWASQSHSPKQLFWHSEAQMTAWALSFRVAVSSESTMAGASIWESLDEHQVDC